MPSTSRTTRTSSPDLDSPGTRGVTEKRLYAVRSVSSMIGCLAICSEMRAATRRSSRTTTNPPAVPAVLADTTPSATIADHSGIAPIIFDTRFRNPASNNWNFGIQRELPGNNVMDIAYVASEAHHLFRQMDGNP